MSVSRASLAAHVTRPSQVVLSSEGLGWDSMLARVYDEPSTVEEFVTEPTSDLMVGTVLTGTYRIESWSARGWRSAHYWPGAVGATAPGHEDRLRWTAPAGERRSSIHLHLPHALLTQTAEDLRVRGTASSVPNSLLLEDPVTAGLLRSVHTLLKGSGEALVADSLAVALAAQLLSGRAVDGTSGVSPDPDGLGRSRLARILDYMNAHLADRVTLDDLAREAHLSRYHFLRQFTVATGHTPHRYLTRLRMARAGDLLRSRRYDVSQVAQRCGYASTASFGTTFRAHFGTTPSAYRQNGRDPGRRSPLADGPGE